MKRTLFVSILLIGSFAIARPQISTASLLSGKPTICSVTINSDEEIEAFKTQIGAKNANFVELTTIGQDDESPDGAVSSREDWFQRACKAKVRCDVMLISGHFGGGFFGKSGLSLPMETLERSSCDATCDGLLQNPKEVYLFGCNTLAGKTRDRRTPEEYRRVLVEDGFSHEQADQIVAYRYSPMGSSYSERMSRTFRGASRIYGFDSIAPSGAHVKNLLKTYLTQATAQNYFTSSNFSTLTTEINLPLARALSVTALAQVPGARSLKRDQVPMCFLEDKSVPFLNKVSWIEKNLSDDQSLSYVPAINEFLSKAQSDNHVWQPNETAILSRVSANGKLRSSLDSIVRVADSAMLTMQVKLLSFMKFFKWETDASYIKRLQEILVGDLNQPFTTERKDQICNFSYSNVVRIALTPSMIPPARFNDVAFVSALSCLASFDESLMVHVLDKYLSLPLAQNELRSSYIAYLQAMKIPQSSAPAFFKRLFPNGEVPLTKIQKDLMCAAAYSAAIEVRLPIPTLKPSTVTADNLENVACYAKPTSAIITQFVSLLKDSRFTEAALKGLSRFGSSARGAIALDAATSGLLISIMAKPTAKGESTYSVARAVASEILQLNKTPQAEVVALLGATIAERASDSDPQILMSLLQVANSWKSPRLNTLIAKLIDTAVSQKKPMNAVALANSLFANFVDRYGEQAAQTADLNQWVSVIPKVAASVHADLVENNESDSIQEILPVSFIDAALQTKPKLTKLAEFLGLIRINSGTNEGRAGTASSVVELTKLMPADLLRTQVTAAYFGKDQKLRKEVEAVIAEVAIKSEPVTADLAKSLVGLKSQDERLNSILAMYAMQAPEAAALFYLKNLSSRENVYLPAPLSSLRSPFLSRGVEWFQKGFVTADSLKNVFVQVAGSATDEWSTYKTAFLSVQNKAPALKPATDAALAKLRETRRECEDNPRGCY